MYATAGTGIPSLALGVSGKQLGPGMTEIASLRPAGIAVIRRWYHRLQMLGLSSLILRDVSVTV